MIKGCLIVMLAFTMLLTPTTAESFDVEAPSTVEAFDSKGYTGAWVQVPELQIEFVLPDGWTTVEPDGDVPYAAANADHSASLTVEAYNAEDYYIGDPLSEWFKQQDVKDGAYTMEEANGQEVAVLRSNATSALTVVVPYEGSLLRIHFERDSEEALSDALALAIVGSIEYYWD